MQGDLPGETFRGFDDTVVVSETPTTVKGQRNGGEGETAGNLGDRFVDAFFVQLKNAEFIIDMKKLLLYCEWL